MTFPDRLTPLIQRLEAGQSLTREDAKRLGQLQALDLAKIGEDFARAAIARGQQQLQDFAKSEEDKRNGH